MINEGIFSYYLMLPPRPHPRLKALPLHLTYLLLHPRIHCTHVALRILEFLNQAKVALLVCLPNHFAVRFLDFLQTNPISADDKRDC